MHLRGHERQYVAGTQIGGQLHRTDAASPRAVHIDLDHRAHRMPVDHHGLAQIPELGVDAHLTGDHRPHPRHQNRAPLHRSALRICQILQRNAVDGDAAAHTVRIGRPERWIAPRNVGGTEGRKHVEKCHEKQSCSARWRRTEVLTQS